MKSEVNILFPTILKLKRTLSPTMIGPMTYREIGERIGKTHQGAQWIVKEGLGDKVNACCPSCLRKLEKESK
jgi:hypothetical protein